MSKKVYIIGGHYGSGKTEFCLNLALELRRTHSNVAVVDLDIANPYFRSREKIDSFAKQGIQIYGNFFEDEVTMEVPALNPNVRAPLEDPETIAIVDLGGDPDGAKVMVQFISAIGQTPYEFLCVVNANRPETGTVERAVRMMTLIEAWTTLKITGLVNNSHFLKETTVETVHDGIVFCHAITAQTKIPLQFNCCPERLVPALKASLSEEDKAVPILPVREIMRASWLDQVLTLS